MKPNFLIADRAFEALVKDRVMNAATRLERAWIKVDGRLECRWTAVRAD